MKFICVHMHNTYELQHTLHLYSPVAVKAQGSVLLYCCAFVFVVVTMPSKIKADFSVGVEPLKDVMSKWMDKNGVTSDLAVALKRIMTVTRVFC